MLGTIKHLKMRGILVGMFVICLLCVCGSVKLGISKSLDVITPARIQTYVQTAELAVKQQLALEETQSRTIKSDRTSPFSYVQRMRKPSLQAKIISIGQDTSELIYQDVLERVANTKQKASLKLLAGDSSLTSSIRKKLDVGMSFFNLKGIRISCPFQIHSTGKDPILKLAVEAKQNTNLLQKSHALGFSKYRTFNGAFNNLINVWRGKLFTPFRRNLQPDYADGIAEPRAAYGGGPLPSARKISFTIHPGNEVIAKRATRMTMIWGQFLDHDLTLASLATIKEGSVDVKCSSLGFKRAVCTDNVPDVGFKLTLQLSMIKCIKEKNFGYDGKQIWVDKGCRGIFTFDKQGSVPCSSLGFKRAVCTDKVPSVDFKLTRQVSITKCIKDENFGYDGKQIWVDKGCRGTFTFKKQEPYQVGNIRCGNDGCSRLKDCFPISIPKDDPYFKGKKCLEFVRSAGSPSLNCSIGKRQQINQLTSWIDASMVYGSSYEQAADLRVNGTAYLKSTPHPFSKYLKPLLPQDNQAECENDKPAFKCFKSGDERTNEQNMLTVMHTFLMREHNRIVRVLNKLYPVKTLNDIEERFQKARKIVGAIIQHITYNEFLPIVFGSHRNRKLLGVSLQSLGKHSNAYDPSLDGTVSNVFGAAAFRFGHSLIPRTVKRADNKYNFKTYKELHLSETFFRPKALYNTKEGGIDAFIRGMYGAKTENVDQYLTQQITRHLFNEHPPFAMGTDLAALNIQRGRDHGIPGYTRWRKWCNLKTVNKFADLGSIFKNYTLSNSFQSVYKNVKDIDLFPAMLSEPPVYGGLLGETLNCIIGREFRNLLHADRFWYERPPPEGFTIGQLDSIRGITLAKIICNNADDIRKITRYVMKAPHPDTNPFVKCSELKDINLSLFQ